MAETLTYPLFTNRVAGRAHLRVYPADLGASRTADVAAVTVELLDAGFDVTVAACHTPTMVATIGRGWHEPRLTVRHITSLAELTAALYEVWARNDARPAVVVEDLMALRTGPGSGHSDDDAASWIVAARTGDADALFDLTGLSYRHYVRLVDPPAPVGAACVMGCRVRRDGDPGDTASIMGGRSLVGGADTVVAVEVHPSAPPVHRCGAPLALGTARLLKSRDAQGTVVPLERTIDGSRRWRHA